MVSTDSMTPSTPGNSNNGQDDVVIAVLGGTGSGKSSFINLLGAGFKTSSKQQSETSEIDSFTFTYAGRSVTIVDTPGSDDSRPNVTPTTLLRDLSAFLCKEYDEGRKLNGLIYVHSLASVRAGGQARSDLKRFAAICGGEAYKNIVVLTTFWDTFRTKKKATERENELKVDTFKEFVDGHARFMGHEIGFDANDDPDPSGPVAHRNACEVLDYILKLSPIHVQHQKEIKVSMKDFEETSAASVRSQEVEDHINTTRQSLITEGMEKDADPARMQDLQERLDKLEAENSNLKGKNNWTPDKSDIKKIKDSVKKKFEDKFNKFPTFYAGTAMYYFGVTFIGTVEMFPGREFAIWKHADDMAENITTASNPYQFWSALMKNFGMGMQAFWSKNDRTGDRREIRS